MVHRVANGLAELGIKADDRIAIDMPMTVESVAIYLGAVAAGCPVVTVADSFAPAEIAVRLGLGQARCIFTQDFALRLGKRLPLYEKVRAADAPQAIVLPCGRAIDCELRDEDLAWQDFLSDADGLPGSAPRSERREHDPLLFGHERRAQGHSLGPDHAYQGRRRCASAS